MSPPIIFPSSALPNRRRRSRLRLEYSVRLHRPGELIPTVTRTEDVSCEGFFFFTDRRFSLSESLNCELVIPGEDSDWLTERAFVLRCRVEVVRVVPQPDESYGVACRVADYTIDDPVLEENRRAEPGVPVLATSRA
jgi:hypothetical protein